MPQSKKVQLHLFNIESPPKFWSLSSDVQETIVPHLSWDIKDLAICKWQKYWDIFFEQLCAILSPNSFFKNSHYTPVAFIFSSSFSCTSSEMSHFKCINWTHLKHFGLEPRPSFVNQLPYICILYFLRLKEKRSHHTADQLTANCSLRRKLRCCNTPLESLQFVLGTRICFPN